MAASFSLGKPSILKNLFFAFIAFGLIIGAIFPVWANLFVNWKEGMLFWFTVSCIVAGISIGLTNYLLMKMILLKRLQCISSTAIAISKNDLTRQLDVNSHDMVGDIANSFNEMTENLRTIVRQIMDVSQRLSSTCSSMNEVSTDTK